MIFLLFQEAFFNNVLFHELSHSLGPAFVGNDEANGEVGKIWKKANREMGNSEN